MDQIENRRAPEDRRVDWGPLDKYIKWSQFMWITGGLVAAGLVLNTFLWNQKKDEHFEIWQNIHQVEHEINVISKETDLIKSELRHIDVTRGMLTETYWRELKRVESKIDELKVKLEKIFIAIDKLKKAEDTND